MIILNELILKLNEKWYDRCRTGKEAIYEYRVFKIFCRAGKTAALWKSGKSAEYFPAGAQPCDQDTGGRVRCSALPERRTKREPEPLRKRIDAGCRGDSGRISSNGGAGGRPSDGRKDSADRNRISARGRNNTTYAAGIRRDLPVYHLQPPDPRDRGGSAGWKIRYRLLLRTAEIRRTRILSPPGILHRGHRPGRSSAGGEREHHTKRSSQVSAGHVFQDERLPQPPRADLRRTGHPGKTRV